MVAIRGYGSYLPLYRIEREAIASQHGDYARGGETAVPAHDEEVVTLAVNAAKGALEHAGVEAADLDAAYAATTSDPFDERGVAAHVAYAVGAAGVRVADFQGAARAATNAVLAARDAVEARGETVLVVAADVVQAAPGTPAERTAGAGAGALVLAEEGDVATLEAAATNTTGFVGRFKRAGSPPVAGDGRFNRARYVEGVTGALERLADAVALDPDRAAMAAPDGGWAGRALSAAELEPERHSAFDAIGYAGAASALIDTALALEGARPGEQLLVVGYGPGGSDALAFTAGDAVDRHPDMTTQEYIDSKEYVTYAKHRDYRERAAGGGD